MHSVAERLTPAPQCTSTPAAQQRAVCWSIASRAAACVDGVLSRAAAGVGGLRALLSRAVAETGARLILSC